MLVSNSILIDNNLIFAIIKVIMNDKFEENKKLTYAILAELKKLQTKEIYSALINRCKLLELRFETLLLSSHVSTKDYKMVKNSINRNLTTVRVMAKDVYPNTYKEIIANIKNLKDALLKNYDKQFLGIKQQEKEV